MTELQFLIVDDDATFCSVLARALKRRHFNVMVAHDGEGAEALARQHRFHFATLDMRLEGPSGLTLIPILKQLQPDMQLLVLTGYASIATTVEAIKLGADNYLPKPADTQQILAALGYSEDASEQQNHSQAPIPEQPMSVSRLEWEHIQKVLTEHQGNISATARALGMHRRTLQRKLAKYPVKR